MSVDSLFQVHMLNEEGKVKAQKIAEAFDLLLQTLGEIGPSSGREYAIVRTKLEEAAFFAKKSMANLSGNQQ